MVYTCFLCKWRSDKPPRRSYHKFPSNTELKQKWLDICGKSNVSVGERTSLCNVHFEESCFRYGLVMGRKILKEGSIPTLHLTRPGKSKLPKQLADGMKPNESEMMMNDLKDPTSKSDVLTCLSDQSPQLETGNTLMEIPVEFCLPKESSRKRTHPESIEAQKKVPSEDHENMECRVCLQKYNDEARLFYIFQPWGTQWDGMGDSIAQDLSQIANIDITSTDPFSKLICPFCHQKLLEACSFVVKARINDKLLRQRVETKHKQESCRAEPIQANPINKSDTFNTNMDIEVKQEALSDDESYNISAHDTFKDSSKGIKHQNIISDWEIKVEHEKTKQPSINHTIVNGTFMKNEHEQNSIMLIGDCKRPRVEPETEHHEGHRKASESIMVYQCYTGSVGTPDQRRPHEPLETRTQNHQSPPQHALWHHNKINYQVS